MELLREFQDVYLQHKIDFGVVDIQIHITLKLEADVKKAMHHKNSKTLQRKFTNS